MKALLAIDSFKGCVSSLQANRAAADGVVASGCGADTLTVPVSDGGEGWIEAFREAMGGIPQWWRLPRRAVLPS